MGFATITNSWVTNASMDTVLGSIRSYMNQQAMKIDEEKPGNPYVLLASQGSGLKSRTLGFAFVSKKDYPKKITIKLLSQDSGKTRVELTLDESLGFIAEAGKPLTAKYYYAAFTEIIADLTKILPPLNVISEAALAIYKIAIDKWEHAGDNIKSNDLKRDIASLLATAVKKADAPFPEAESLLAGFLDDIGEDEEARKYALLALQHNPDDFRAQLVIVDYYLKGVKVMKLGAGSFLATDAGGFTANAVGSVLRSAISLGQTAIANFSQSTFKNELLALIKAYRTNCQNNTDVDEFIFMSESLISLGDLIKNFPIYGGRPNLYQEVVDAPTDKLIKNGRDGEIMEICAKAEGRLMFFKP